MLPDAIHRSPGGGEPELTQLALGDIETTATPGNLFLDLDDGCGQPTRVLRRDAQDVEGDALRGLRTDPWEATEFIDQALDRTGVDRGHAVTPRRVDTFETVASAKAEGTQIDTASDATHPLRLQRLRGAVRIRHCGHDQILEHLDVVRVHHIG